MAIVKKAQVRKEVVLWRDDVEWLRVHYPTTTLSSVLMLLLHEFKTLHGEHTPKTYAQEAAKRIHQ